MTITGGGYGSSGWQIVDAESYDESITHAGGYLYVDAGLAWVDWFLHRNPLAFKQLQPGSQIRFVKTKLRIKGTVCFPSYRLLFTVDKEAKVVTKLHVKACPPEEMDYGDPWDEYDDPTF